MNSAFLYHAIQAGMDMGIVNAGQLDVYDQIEPDLLARVEDVLFARRPDATDRLIQFASMTPLNKEAKRQAPKETGQLKRSIGKKIKTYKNDGVVWGGVGVRSGFRVVIDGKEHIVNPHDAVFINPGDHHSIANHGDKPFKIAWTYASINWTTTPVE